MTALGAFSPGDVLTAADLNAIGTWTSYTPTFTGITVGSATVDFKYVQVNELVLVNGKFTLGAGSSVTTGFYFSMPPSLDSTQNWSGSAHARVGSTNYAATCAIRNAGTAYLWIHNASGTYATWALASNTVPGTWSSGNYFFVNFFYRAA
jgi:hypothetical protein